SLPVSTNSSSAKLEGPRIQFAATGVDFGKVDSGRVVNYSFVFTNTGDQVLEIKSVRPSCGCTTTTNWDRQVEPGKLGRIPLLFNPGGYSGTVFKTIAVDSDDPTRPSVMLQIVATIWKPIEAIPELATFNLSPDSQSNQTRVIKIVNHLDEP